MIRKDQLPDIWGDDFERRAENGDRRTVSGKASFVLCDEEDWPLFQVNAHDGYTPHADLGHLHLDVEEGAEVELYRLQYRGSEKVTHLDITMQAHAHLRLFTLTLGGDHVRNNIVVRMQGEGSELEADGLYLVDHEQQCDNYIFVEHARPHCKSRALYKGIVDDSARARFNGHVLVQDGAVKTEAYQTNRNILLTDKAHVDTRPFLEIYNDDVKCSHGSTIGQLDEQALYYLRTRGIPQRTAVTMLSYAFCDEVIRGISIEPLRDAVGDMVKKRLHGEPVPCAECAIACKNPCNGPDAHFYIDPNKL